VRCFWNTTTKWIKTFYSAALTPHRQ
jgi:hypothetical protein